MKINMCAAILNYRLNRVHSPQTQNAAKRLVFQKKRKKKTSSNTYLPDICENFRTQDGERRGSTTS